MKLTCFLFLSLYLFCCPVIVDAQQFRGGIVGGLGATTVAGDRTGGYNKLGLYAGGYINLKVGQQSSLQMELAYFQKGAQRRQSQDLADPSQYRLRLNYIELPVVYQYRIGAFRGEAGVAFDFLIGQSEKVNSLIVLRDIWKGMTFNSILGVAYDLNDKVSLSFRRINSLHSIHRGTFSGNIWRFTKKNMGAFNDAYLLSVYYRL